VNGQRYVVAGMNIFRCKHCGKRDPKGTAFIPITMRDLAIIRANGMGAVDGKCQRGHQVSYVLIGTARHGNVEPVLISAEQ